MESKDINQYEFYIKILFQIYCFQKEIDEKNNSDYETPKNSQSSEYSIFYIKKSVMKKYKKLFDYETFISIIEKSNILDMLKDNGYLSYKNSYNEIVLKDLFKYLDNFPNYINKIKRLNKNEIIRILIEKDQKKWKNKFVTFQKDNEKKEVKLINEFEIINEDIYNLFFKNQNFDILKGNYYFGRKKMIILIINKNDAKCLIGNLTNDGFKSKYLVDMDSIDKISLQEFFDNLIKFGIGNILKINKKNEVNKILIDGKQIIIYKIKDSFFNSYYIKGKNKLLGKVKDQYINNETNDNNNNIDFNINIENKLN